VKGCYPNSFHSVLSGMICYCVEFSFIVNNVVNDVVETSAQSGRFCPAVWVGDCRRCRVSVQT